MKIEFHLEGPHVCAWFASAVTGYNEARAKDVEAWDAKYGPVNNAFASSVGSGAATPTSSEGYTAQAQAANPQPAEAEKPKRTRKAKEDPAPTVELETAAQITTSPEDRKPVEDIEEAEVVDVFEEAPAARVFTRDDVKAAMQAYVAKHGMDKLAANAADLLGAPKLSSIPEDPAAFEAAVKRLEAALA